MLILISCSPRSGSAVAVTGIVGSKPAEDMEVCLLFRAAISATSRWLVQRSPTVCVTNCIWSRNPYGRFWLFRHRKSDVWLMMMFHLQAIVNMTINSFHSRLTGYWRFVWQKPQEQNIHWLLSLQSTKLIKIISKNWFSISKKNRLIAETNQSVLFRVIVL